MKKSFLLLFFWSTFFLGKSQWVAIPDSNFGYWLLTNYSNCSKNDSQGFWLDTTCHAVLTDTFLYCDGYGIRKLDGIQYFKSLKILDCETNGIDTMSIFPPKLEELDCGNNYMTSISNLPSTLKSLFCPWNNLQTLPNLPNNLESLVCMFNQLTSIPTLPQSLQGLDCSGNNITILPAFPNSLKWLSANRNKLSSLPILSNKFQDLEIRYNNISNLPAHLPDSLITLYCDSNPISVIPKLPKTLQSLSCTFNPNISCLPKLPDSLYEFYISGTNIHCIPNQFKYLNTDWGGQLFLPLCDVQSGCNINYNIAGNTHQDISLTCLDDSLNHSYNLQNIKVLLLSNNQIIQQTSTNRNGEYSFDTDSLTNYEVQIDTANLPFEIACPTNGIRKIQLRNIDSISVHQDFGIKCKGVDEGIQTIYGRFRAAQNSIVEIFIGDIESQNYNANCANNSSGTVTTTFMGGVQYVSPAPNALTPSVSGNTLTYNIADFSTLSANAFNIILSTDTLAQLGTSVCISTSVSTTASDVDLTNNQLTMCFPVVNSFDPNVKTVYPEKITNTEEWLTYTIHFQNTGNDTAYNVVLKDTLNPALNAASFQFLAASFNPIISVKDNQINFSFDQINLPDSATNPTGSEAWVQFKVKTKANLPISTEIKNQAAIYFDFNPAVFTNVAKSKFYNSICDCEGDSPFKVYPNPNKGQFFVEIPENLDGAMISVTDICGRTIHTQSIFHSKTNKINLETPSGIYFATLVKEKSKKVARLIVF